MADCVFTANYVDLFRNNHAKLERRQIPIVVDENLTVTVKFNHPRDPSESTSSKQKEILKFTRKYNLFTQPELDHLLNVDENMVTNLMARVVPCVGCRRSIERLYSELIQYQHPALDPFQVSDDGTFKVRNDYLCNPGLMGNLFYKYGARLNSFIETIPKTKKNRRCLLHSLDSHKVRPAGNWLDVWEQMTKACQKEVLIIGRDVLSDTLDTYLRKHRFCGECKSKVQQAFSLLVEEADSSKEQDFLPSLYQGMIYCTTERHIHVDCNTDFVANLMSRAEPELRGSRREKHAKTIDIAQEEVLICIGICLYERLHRINQRMREEEQTWQIMFHLAIECLKTKFEMTVEKKQGKSQLELLCEEIQMAELAKQQKRDHKRQKRKEKKDRLRIEAGLNVCPNVSICPCVENSQVSLCKLCHERRSLSTSRSSTPVDDDGEFLTVLPHSCDDSSPNTPPLASPVITPKRSTCSCSSNRFLPDDLVNCDDGGYISGSNNSSRCSNSSSCSCEDECLYCGRTKPSWDLCFCWSPLFHKCRLCIKQLSLAGEIIQTVPPNQWQSLYHMLEAPSTCEEDNIPASEHQIMQAKAWQESQERIEFRENLRRRFQDLQKMTKFRFRPFAYCKLCNQYIRYHN